MLPLTKRKHYLLLLICLTLLLVAAFMVSISHGEKHIPFSQVCKVLLSCTWNGIAVSSDDKIIVVDMRLPRILLAILVGASLAAVGVVMQGFFQNPMAGPYIIGVSSGASLGATIAILYNLNFWLMELSAVPLLAFVGALITTFIVYSLSTVGGRTLTTTLLLTGIAVGAMASAASSFIIVIKQRDLNQVVFWLMGHLSDARWDYVRMILPYFIVSVFVICIFARDLNVMLTGEESAHHLGIEVERVKRILLIFSSLLAAAAVSVSGVIGFVGLVVPHLTRLLTGPDHTRLLPAAIIVGGVILLASDFISRILIEDTQIPIGIITSLIGCPFFLYLLWKSRREVG